MSRPGRVRGRGFTLVELMIVVVLIGLLAALALPAFSRMKSAAVARRYYNDARQIRDAAQRYALEHGAFPPNGIGALAPEFTGYVPAKLFGATTPLGGVWDWDNGENGFAASIAVYQYTVSDAELLAIDRAFDDGDLTAGQFRRAGAKAILVVEF